MKEQRLVLAHRVVLLKQSVSVVARELGVSRKTAYKWIGRYRVDPAGELSDRSRRPHRSPKRSDGSIEQAVLSVHDQHRWGARKIHRVLAEQKLTVPSIRTTAAILKRHGRVGIKPQEPAREILRFERSGPNHLWQLDHKGPLEIARERFRPLTVIDDHSRYCLRFVPASDVTLATTWALVWDLFGEMGLPDALLCDNAFSAPIGLSVFDVRLIRLGIRPIHGRPYHPQTQGKVERLHGSIQRELIDFNARRDCLEHFIEDTEAWRRVYNTMRPHEALDDQPPAARYRPSSRKRPASLPPVEYPAGAMLRRVSQVGDICYRQGRIVVGRALAREHVQVVVREHDVAVYYATKLIRVISNDLFCGRKTNKIL